MLRVLCRSGDWLVCQWRLLSLLLRCRCDSRNWAIFGPNLPAKDHVAHVMVSIRSPWTLKLLALLSVAPGANRWRIAPLCASKANVRNSKRRFLMTHLMPSISSPLLFRAQTRERRREWKCGFARHSQWGLPRDGNLSLPLALWQCFRVAFPQRLLVYRA